jgi:hypothetical protein
MFFFCKVLPIAVQVLLDCSTFTIHWQLAIARVTLTHPVSVEFPHHG